MSKPLRLLAMAAAINMTAASVSAQTVIVRGATPGETVEVIVNTDPAAKGTVAADGTATVAANLPMNEAGKQEMDSRLYVDACDKLRRVQIVERNRPPAPVPAGCSRSEVGGIYWVRQRSTIVIDVSRPIPDVLLRQGAYNPNAPVKRLAPPGLMLFGGGGLAQTSEAARIACGNLADCGDDGYVGAYTAGATLWITRWLGVEGSYVKPSRMVVEGNGGSFTFTSELDVHVVNLVGKLGIPLGPVRLFGQGGGTYHEGTTTMTQTIGEASQTVETRTDGWSYTYGGGIEAWISDRFGLYGEAGSTKIKGKERLAGVITIDDTVTHFLFGARFRIF
ncbi:MAG TPA: outer membrane beta-barrel protein [Vicinamibacterales bacterium]|nr:outer membrane beta-barrel protein [Vicinamibacterales bacterium]